MREEGDGGRVGLEGREGGRGWMEGWANPSLFDTKACSHPRVLHLSTDAWRLEDSYKKIPLFDYISSMIEGSF